jgi:hypothetical protein
MNRVKKNVRGVHEPKMIIVTPEENVVDNLEANKK